MVARVTVVDYGSGNLFSVTRALEHCGGEPVAAHDAAAIEAAERLVLPGVGAFADGMQGLHERGLVEAIQRFAASGRPLLGICLGMQMLATVSEEFGSHHGLGIIPGRVLPVPAHDVDGTPQRIPHIGWTSLRVPRSGTDWQGSMLKETPAGTEVYLVHSFAVVPDNEADRLADCDYGGHRLCAALRRGNVFGAQFHPEKSGPAGLAMLSTFLRRS
jgi:imidazole glycerol-phosphate synthase subunit HisH